MLDKKLHRQIVESPDGFDYRINVRSRPSFGLGSLRNRKWLLAAGILLGLAGASFYVGSRSATYTASSQILVFIRQILTGPDLAVLPGRADLPMVQNQIELMRSGNVLGKVIEALQLTYDPEFVGAHRSLEPAKSGSQTSSSSIEEDRSAYAATLDAMTRKLGVRQVGTSHMITVSFKASDSEKAARIVNSVIRIYLQESTRASDAASSRTPTLREIYQNLGPSAQVVSQAEPPLKADGPPAALIFAVAALLGLLVSAAVALFLDAVNDTIRSPQQMEHVLGLECLGIVRRFSNIGVQREDFIARRLLALKRPPLQRAVAMLQDASSRGLRTIGLTATLPGEGATTLAIGLAEMATVSGRRVLLIDAVPENPSVSRWIADLPSLPLLPGSKSEYPGLDHIVEVQAGLHVLPLAGRFGGGKPLIPPDLLDGILNAIGNNYDLVIVDMPSLVESPQVRAAAQSLDGFLLVVKWGTTKSELVRQAFRSAGPARAKFIGAVLNAADEEAMKRYGYELSIEPKSVAAS